MRRCLHRWNNLAVENFVNDYNNFNLEKDFPNLYRCVVIYPLCRPRTKHLSGDRWHQALISRPSAADALARRKAMI